MFRSVVRIVLVTILAVLVGAVVLSPTELRNTLERWMGLDTNPPRIAGDAGGGFRGQPKSAAGSAGGWTPRRWREHVQGEYRLPPDGRFLRAARWLAGTDGEGIKGIEHEDGQWQFAVGERRVTLDDAAGFEPLYGVLRDLAPATSQSYRPASDADRLPLRTGYLLAELSALSDRHDVRDNRTAAARAARLTARLLLLQDDRLGVGDALAVRALATLAIAESAGTPLALERSMVAWALNYHAYARRVARESLPADHPWRRYLQHRPVSVGDGAGPLAEYLNVRRAAYQLQDRTAWRESARQARVQGVGPLALATTAYGLDSFGLGYQAMVLVPSLATEVAAGRSEADLELILSPPKRVSKIDFSDPGAAAKKLATALGELYQELIWDWTRPDVVSFEGVVGAKRDSWLAGNSVRRAVLGSAFYGAVYRRGRFHLDKQSNYADAEKLITWLADQPGPHADALAELYRHRIAAERGEVKKPEQFMAALDQLAFGPKVTWTLFSDALERMSWREGVRETAFRRFGGFDASVADRVGKAVDGDTPMYPRALDSRPTDRYSVVRHAEATLYRPILAQRLRREAIAQMGRGSVPRLALESARRLSDADALRGIGGDERIRLGWRAAALEALAEQSHVEEASRRLERLAIAHAGEWEVRESWIEVLRDQKRYAKAREVARGWREAYGTRRGTRFDYLDALIAEARAAMAQGDLEAAEALSRDIYGFMGAAREFRFVIDLLEARGNQADAREVAEKLRDAYPHTLRDVLPLARLYWCHGDVGAAADVLEQFEPGIRGLQWRHDVAAPFAECLAEHPEKAAAATRELVGRGFRPHYVLFVAEHLDDIGHPETAYAAAAALSSRNPTHQVFLDVRAAGFLLNAEGSERATSWLKGRIPQRMRGPASEPIYWFGAHQLLWSVVPDIRRQPYRDGVWLLRAASVAVDRTRDEERIERARAALRGEPETFYGRMGRMVLGVTKPQTVAERTMRPKRLVESTYYLGVRAVADGRPRDAVKWFVACKAAGEHLSGQTEYRWAREIVARVAAEGALQRNYDEYGADYLMPWGPETVADDR